jgi:hypothetical protein
MKVATYAQLQPDGDPMTADCAATVQPVPTPGSPLSQFSQIPGRLRLHLIDETKQASQ